MGKDMTYFHQINLAILGNVNDVFCIDFKVHARDASEHTIQYLCSGLYSLNRRVLGCVLLLIITGRCCQRYQAS